MLPGRSLVARVARGNEIEMLGEDFRFERLAGLRPAQYGRYVRRHESVIARARGTFGARTPEARHFENGSGLARRKGVRRLEPERRTQDDGECLFAPREGAADRFDAGDLGRSAKLPEEKEREAAGLPIRQSA